MRRIGIDCRFAPTQSGLGRYTREVVTHLLKRHDPIEYVLFVKSPDEEWLQRLQSPNCNQPSPSLRPACLQTATSPHYSLREQLFFPIQIARTGIDLFFSPHFNVPFVCPVPYIVTIHDLILHEFPNEAPLHRRLAYRILMQRSVRGARTIIAVSRFTATAIQKKYQKKSVPIPEGVGEEFHPRSLQEQESARNLYNLKKPFFLYVGNAKEHKNVRTLIEAFQSLGDSTREFLLVLGGREMDDLPQAPGVRIIPGVTDSELAALYSSAICFITASLYEGFCLPAAEALACGCPVIASRRGAIPEVLSPHATLIEPTVDAFVWAMRSPPDCREPRQFRSWDEVASEVAKVLLSNDVFLA